MRRRTGLRAAGVLVLSALMVSGCALRGTAPATPESLVGTWSLAEKVNAPEQPYLSFLADGSWSASDGCNRARGGWDLDADGAISVTAGPQTRLECDGAALPDALTTAERVEVRGDVLILHGARAAVTELARTRDPLVGPQRLPLGFWQENDTDGSPFLFIGSKGSFYGNDGCNTLTGPWEATDDGAIRFPATVSTEKFCEGVDAWLGRAVIARSIGGVMTLQSEDGTVIGQLRARR